MPDKPKTDYEEARTILDLSPRGACALLRLALQELSKELGQDGNNLNGDIAALVAQGLSVEVQQALDALRVVGNNAVHPGEFDVTDDTETALALCECLNVIVEQRIAQPRRIEQLYDRLPRGAREAIEKRDAPGA
jgi:predicted naringenin-chalcone synthase